MKPLKICDEPLWTEIFAKATGKRRAVYTKTLLFVGGTAAKQLCFNTYIATA